MTKILIQLYSSCSSKLSSAAWTFRILFSCSRHFS